jgi:hypothetical protein
MVMKPVRWDSPWAMQHHSLLSAFILLLLPDKRYLPCQCLLADSNLSCPGLGRAWKRITSSSGTDATSGTLKLKFSLAVHHLLKYSWTDRWRQKQRLDSESCVILMLSQVCWGQAVIYTQCLLQNQHCPNKAAAVSSNTNYTATYLLWMVEQAGWTRHYVQSYYFSLTEMSGRHEKTHYT